MIELIQGYLKLVAVKEARFGGVKLPAG